MNQTLYLNAPGVRRVNLDGPALRIQSRGEADRFLPLARIGRIVSRGRIQWSTAALLHCLQAGIAVTFLDRDGRLLGMGFGAWPRDSRLSELLDHFFTLDDGPRRLVDWFRGLGRARLLRLLRHHRIETEDLRIRTVRRTLRRAWAERFPGLDPDPVSRIKPLAAAQAAEILASYRINPALLEPGHDWAGLIWYLTCLLEWELWDLALTGRFAAGPAYRERVTAYQRHSGHLERRTRAVIGQLWRWLESSGSYLP